MLMGTTNNNEINKNETKPVLLIEDPPGTDPLINRFLSLKIEDSLSQDLNLQDHDRFDTASTNTIFGSFFSNDLQLQHCNSDSDSDEEIPNKSVSEIRIQYIEDERKWLRYKIDSVTKEQAIILCITGQGLERKRQFKLVLCPEDITGSRDEVPLPEDAKQILLLMTYGDHWLLRQLSYVLEYFEKANNLIMSMDGLVDLLSSSRSYLEALISNQFGISRIQTLNEVEV